MTQNVIDLLKERGFVDSISHDSLKECVDSPITLYCGFDPTADSLHLGHMIGLMALSWFQKCGHTPIVLIGGATAMIGDPSGKSQERNLLDEQTVALNVSKIQEKIALFFSKPPQILNNFDWYGNFSLIRFLRNVGKSFRLGPMLAKESVRQRMASEEGISYTEFTYQILQSYDYLYLQKNYGVSLQVGGSDQWGNITAGIDYIRKSCDGIAYGLTFPLLTGSDGQKLGKTEKGAVWLSSEKLSPYDFYQYFFRIPDKDVCRLMRLLTFMDLEEIATYEQNMTPNAAQKRLAEEVTRLVHGDQALQEAIHTTENAAPGRQTALNADALLALEGKIPSFSLSKEELLDCQLIDLIVNLKIQESKGAVRRLMRNGGIYLNNDSILDENRLIQKEDLIENQLILIGIGKKNKFLLHLNPK